LYAVLLGNVALAAQATLPTPTHFSTLWSVCQKSLYHIRDPCLNYLTNSDATLQAVAHMSNSQIYHVI